MFLKNKPLCANTYQASVFLMLANVSVANASPVTHWKFSMGGDYIRTQIWGGEIS